MARILRGEVRWADLNPVRGHEQAGHRPVLILSHDIFNARSGTVIAVALTSQPQKAGFPLTLELKVAQLRKPTWAKISQIRALSVERIRSEEHTSELQSPCNLVCRLLLEKKKTSYIQSASLRDGFAPPGVVSPWTWSLAMSHCIMR